MNASAFLPLAFLFNPFAGFTSAKATTYDTNGFSNPVVGPSTGGGSICISGDITVSLNTPGTKLLYKAPEDQMAVTESIVEMFQVDSTFAANATAGGPSVISGEYSIFVKLCLPSDPEKLAKIKTLRRRGYGSRLRDPLLRSVGCWEIRPP
ncbi:hypothetical protein O1611_g2792 [Lasiodiplodia mahajangana]|uniref:Uncharacterized protein n=1 Tax=Lasiodiplodia mahajangana TaxID=1108764 RepID=A0ACC2JTK2_9PEZI|nr:hypothetical protein O1611_g2792 [Lasiodiplodia mahajangana]